MTEQQLQDYASGKLPPEEAAAVKEAVAGDPTLAAKVAEYERLFAALRRERLEEIEEELEEFIEELPVPGEKENPTEKTAKVVTLPERERRRFPLRWIAGAAAAVALLLFIFWPKAPVRAELVASYFAPPENDGPAGEIDPETLDLDRAKETFFAGRYAAAVAAFKQLLDSAEYRGSARFYLPFALHLAGDLTAADRAFAEALADNQYEAKDRERLRWNAMLNDLARGEDISEQLARPWSERYPAEELRTAVPKLPPLRE